MKRFILISVFLTGSFILLMLLSNSGKHILDSTPLQSTPTSSNAFVKEASTSADITIPSIGERIKISACVSVNGLPDKVCTSGDIDPRVTQDNIQQTICVKGYTQTVRPPVAYTNQLKMKQIIEYGYTDTNPKDYEEDHLISLELGGSPTSEANLWPESYTSTPTARDKDKVENYLHAQVCSGKMSLKDAQFKISNNWEEFYQTSF